MNAFRKAQSIETNKGNVAHMRPLLFSVPKVDVADVSTSWLSCMDTSESLSTCIPGSRANRSELQNKMKPLSPGLHKLREIIAVDEIPPGPDKAAGKLELVESQK